MVIALVLHPASLLTLQYRELGQTVCMCTWCLPTKETATCQALIFSIHGNLRRWALRPTSYREVRDDPRLHGWQVGGQAPVQVTPVQHVVSAHCFHEESLHLYMSLTRF